METPLHTATPHPADADARQQGLLLSSPAVSEGRGRNVIPPPEREPLWRGFVHKFEDPLMVVLLVVFMFSLTVSVYEVTSAQQPMTALLEPLGVLTALLLATGVGFIFEVRAESEFRVLAMKRDERGVKVWRRRSDTAPAEMMVVERRDVCVGDMVWLESGDEVPADAVLVETRHLLVDESAFTGEQTAEKFVVAVAGAAAKGHESTYPPDTLLRGTIVLEGNALARVTAVGVDTEEGHGAMTLRQEEEVPTPLAAQLTDLGKAITRASYIVAALIVAGRMVYYLWVDHADGDPFDWLEATTFFLNSVLLAVTLIVVAVPEGLPMSVTVSLALSMRKMLKENNLVRRLHACETMGAATVVCTDKTGTLTLNSMEVAKAVTYAGMDEIARAVAVNSTATVTTAADGTQQRLGNPTEAAMLAWIATEHGMDWVAMRREASIKEQHLFSSESKQMDTIAAVDGGKHCMHYVKGAPEVVLAECDDIGQGHSRKEAQAAMTHLAAEGYRTLGIAAASMEGGKQQRLTYLATIALADPVRPDVPAAMRVCTNAGVRVIMVTGDVASTATTIARQTGIIAHTETDALTLTGAEFEALTDDTVKEQVLPRLRVLARARPTDKLRLVRLLQESGEVVAVTGDGTNDALALKRAQVGLSMGSGTARAKEASDITILDNSFATINKAILWGRSLYRNIQRFILFQMTINITACMIVLVGAMTGLETPLTVTQMLWVNLIMDTFAAMALSSLPPDSRVMSEKPRNPRSHIIDRRMGRHIIGSGLFFYVVMLTYWRFLHTDDGMLGAHDMGLFFTAFVFIQFWNLFNARYYSTGRSLIGDIMATASAHRHGDKPRDAALSRGFVAIITVILIGQVVIVNGAATMFNVAPLHAREWLLLLAATMPVMLVPDLWRYFRSRH